MRSNSMPPPRVRGADSSRALEDPRYSRSIWMPEPSPASRSRAVGSGPGQFDLIHGIAVDRNNRNYEAG